MTMRHRHAKRGAMDYQFCPKCGGSLALLSIKKIEPPRLVCDDCRFVFYLDPKVAAAAVVPYKGGIVLLKRSVEPGFGRWVIPGGFVDRGETPEEAAVRETKEESNLDVVVRGLIGVYTYPGPSVVVLTYLAEHVGGTLRPSDESSDAKTVPHHRIPWSTIAFESSTSALRDYLATFRGTARRPRRPRPGFTPGPLSIHA